MKSTTPPTCTGKKKLSTFIHTPTTTTISIYIIIMMSINACIPSAISTPTPTQTKEPIFEQVQEADEPYSGAVFYPEQVTPQPVCYRVTAIKALNLRAEPEIKSPVLAWLPTDKTVTYLSTVQGVWYQIEADGIVGYSHSNYLERSNCK